MSKNQIKKVLVCMLVLFQLIQFSNQVTYPDIDSAPIVRSEMMDSSYEADENDDDYLFETLGGMKYNTVVVYAYA